MQSRAGKGVINVKTVERNGKVVGVLSVTEDSEVMLISQQGKIARLDSSKIRESGRSAQGVRLINLDEGDQVAAASPDPERHQRRRPRRAARPIGSIATFQPEVIFVPAAMRILGFAMLRVLG